MVDAADPNSATPGAFLAQTMRERGMGKRRLAAALHEANPDVTLESYRHSIYRWLAGEQPSDHNRALLARVLLVDPGQFETRPVARSEQLEEELRELRDRVAALEADQQARRWRRR
jgi:putative ubiquitin-RnfH superfamily antitoxin RatB of RatAB toxin-antitoxin module